MPRPRKCRQVCRLPRHDAFAPVGCARSAEAVVITVDEYETIRLIDYEGLSQEECAASMGVARTTVQQIYNTARGEALRRFGGGAAFPHPRGRLPGCARGNGAAGAAVTERIATRIRVAPGNRRSSGRKGVLLWSCISKESRAKDLQNRNSRIR